MVKSHAVLLIIQLMYVGKYKHTRNEVGAAQTLAAFRTFGTPIRPFNGLEPQSSSSLGKRMRSSRDIKQFPSILLPIRAVYSTTAPCHFRSPLTPLVNK